MRRINKLLLIFLALTLFFIVIHIKRTAYFESPSNEVIERIYSGGALVSTSLSFGNEGYGLNVSFSDIQGEVLVKTLNVGLVAVGKDGNTNLRLSKVLPYSGMHNWDVPEFETFQNIPDSLRQLSVSDNPYFSYDFIFESDEVGPSDRYLAEVAFNNFR